MAALSSMSLTELKAELMKLNDPSFVFNRREELEFTLGIARRSRSSNKDAAGLGGEIGGRASASRTAAPAASSATSAAASRGYSSSNHSAPQSVSRRTATDTVGQVWRFGYGSNIGLATLENRKNVSPSRYIAGSIGGWELCFKPGIPYVEPGWAGVRPAPDGDDGAEVHGSAFLINEDEAAALDWQEGGYNVVPSRFVSYDGEVIEGVGIYVPKSGWSGGAYGGTPSLRYLRLMRRGAREAGLSEDWIRRLDSIPHYVTPPKVRRQTERWIAEFRADRSRRDELWTADALSKLDGSNPAFPAHVSVMGYIVRVGPARLAPGRRISPSWKGHDVTRRNILQFNGESLDKNDIRYGQPGFRPLPKLACCSHEEREFLFQNLESLLHRGGTIVAQLKEFLEDQYAWACPGAVHAGWYPPIYK